MRYVKNGHYVQLAKKGRQFTFVEILGLENPADEFGITLAHLSVYENNFTDEQIKLLGDPVDLEGTTVQDMMQLVSNERKYGETKLSIKNYWETTEIYCKGCMLEIYLGAKPVVKIYLDPNINYFYFFDGAEDYLWDYIQKNPVVIKKPLNDCTHHSFKDEVIWQLISDKETTHKFPDYPYSIYSGY